MVQEEGLIIAWIQLVYFLFMLDSTSGIRCLSCRSVKHITDCNHVITCAQDNICHVSCQHTLGSPGLCDLTCTPRSHCPLRPLFTSGLGGTSFSACCDNEDSCVLHMPELFPSKVTHLDPPKIAGSTLVELHSTTYLFCRGNESMFVNHTWLFNGGSTLPPHAVAHDLASDSGYLEIRDMTRSKVWTYTCIIAKDGVTANASVVVSVIEERARVIEVTAFPTHPGANYPLDLVCHVKGFPQPTIIWSFRDPMGQNYMPPGSSNQTPEKVHIDKFQPSQHSGTWTCMVRNSLGVDQMSIQI